MLEAMDDNIAPITNIIMPITNTLFLPYMSPNEPLTKISDDKHIAYAPTTH